MTKYFHKSEIIIDANKLGKGKMAQKREVEISVNNRKIPSTVRS